jgi:26S proteasome regulatory subunit N2
MNVYSSDASFKISAKAIDEYASLRSKAVESNEMVDIDPRLEAIVERMLGKYAMLIHLMLLFS